MSANVNLSLRAVAADGCMWGKTGTADILKDKAGI